MLHYTPQHVSSSTLLIIRRTNCVNCDTIGPPDDERRAARNMLECSVTYVLLKIKRIVH